MHHTMSVCYVMLYARYMQCIMRPFHRLTEREDRLEYARAMPEKRGARHGTKPRKHF